MNLRRILGYTAAGVALVGGAMLLAIGFGAAQSLSQRISFQILTGSTGGTYFPVGQLIAGLLSHPPGVDRCEAAPVCGPPGVIISARTSDGAGPGRPCGRLRCPAPRARRRTPGPPPGAAATSHLRGRPPAPAVL